MIKGKIQLNYAKLKYPAMIYMSLPLFAFFIGFCRWQFAAPACALLAFALVQGVRKSNVAGAHSEPISLAWWEPLLFLAAALLWTFLGGLNGFFYQSSDWPWRNAIYHDLISYNWPVVYRYSGNALTYYVGFWLPPALAAKLATAAGAELDTIWTIARMALWVWSALGIWLTMLLLSVYVKANRFGKRLVSTLTLIGFSGMDILGALCYGTAGKLFAPDALHLEWWSPSGNQFSSLTTCVFWVFNQSILPWLVVICFLFEKNARNYLFLAVACLCCGPFPLVGLLICMVARWLSAMRQAAVHEVMLEELKNTFSLHNLGLLFSAVPLLATYYLCNNALLQSFSAKQEAGGAVPLQTVGAVLGGLTAGLVALVLLVLLLDRWKKGRKIVLTILGAAAGAAVLAGLAVSGGFLALARYFTLDLLFFYLLEIGLYLLLVWKEHRREPLFYTVAASLLIIPFFRIGASTDFGMRASIPGVFIVMVYADQLLLRGMGQFHLARRKTKLRYAGLVAALLVGAFTPGMEIYRGFYHAQLENWDLNKLENGGFTSIAYLEEASNFCTEDYFDKFFFAYLSRPTGYCTITYGDGFYYLEKQAIDNRTVGFHWCDQTSNFVIYNDRGYAFDAKLEMAFNVVNDRNIQYHMTVTANGKSETYYVMTPMQDVVLTLRLAPGKNTVVLTTDRPEEQGKGDLRNLYCTVGRIRLYDPAGNLIAYDPDLEQEDAAQNIKAQQRLVYAKQGETQAETSAENLPPETVTKGRSLRKAWPGNGKAVNN